jgi:hypothetical protein
MASLAIQDAGRQNPPRRVLSEQIAAGRDFRKFGRKPGRLPANRSGIPPFIYAAKVKVKGGFQKVAEEFSITAFAGHWRIFWFGFVNSIQPGYVVELGTLLAS